MGLLLAERMAAGDGSVLVATPVHTEDAVEGVERALAEAGRVVVTAARVLVDTVAAAPRGSVMGQGLSIPSHGCRPDELPGCGGETPYQMAPEPEPLQNLPECLARTQTAAHQLKKLSLSAQAPARPASLSWLYLVSHISLDSCCCSWGQWIGVSDHARGLMHQLALVFLGQSTRIRDHAGRVKHQLTDIRSMLEVGLEQELLHCAKV